MQQRQQCLPSQKVAEGILLHLLYGEVAGKTSGRDAKKVINSGVCLVTEKLKHTKTDVCSG